MIWSQWSNNNRCRNIISSNSWDGSQKKKNKTHSSQISNCNKSNKKYNRIYLDWIIQM